MHMLNNIRDVWVYDNPDTSCRELYRHGHLLTFYPASAFPAKEDKHTYPWYGHEGADRWVQEMYIADARSLGPWQEGQEFGDRIHKPFDPLATQIYIGQDI